MEKRTNKGFTLMEMLIVVAIIAILAAIAVPVFSGILSRAKETACQANCRSLQTVLAAAQIDTGAESLAEAWKGADADTRLVWAEQCVCPAGGEITVVENTVGCSVHRDNRTIEQVLMDDFNKVVTSWDPTTYGSNDRFRAEYLKQYGGSYPQVKIGGTLYYAHPYYNADTKEICIFARTDQANSWYTSWIYDKEEEKWYTGQGGISVANKTWESIKGEMTEKGWTPAE